ncbi:MAG: ATP-binding protein [Saprospiraceae bacterium]
MNRHSRRRFYFFWLAGLMVLFFNVAWSQQNQIDSLKQVLHAVQDEAQKAEVMMALSREYVGLDYEKAFEFGKKAVASAEKTDSLKLQFICYYTLGRVCAVGAMHLDTGVIYTEKALTTAHTIQDTQQILLAHMLAAAIYDYTDQSKKAVDHYETAVPLARAFNDPQYSSSIYNNLGLMYHYSEDTLNARKYYGEAIAIFKETGDTLSWARVMANLSSLETDTDKAIDMNLKALSLLDRIAHNPQLKEICADKIGNLYLQGKGDATTALTWFQKALALALEAKVEPSVASAHFGIGKALLLQNRVDSAIWHLKFAHNYYSKEGYQADNLQRVSKDYSEALARAGRFAEAYPLLLESFQIKDSIYTTELASAISEFNAKYEKEQNEAKLVEEKLKTSKEMNRKNGILIGSLILLTVAGFVFQYLFNRQRRRKKEADLALEKERFERNKLEELDTLKTRFFANISHELRTPLTLVMAPLEKALSNKPIHPKLEEDLKLAHSNSAKLLTLVNEILDLSKLESGKLDLDMQSTPLKSFLERVVYSFQSLSEFREIKLGFTYEGSENLAIETDRDKLEKILNNLLSNAIKFTDAGGDVHLKAKTETETLEIKVSDTGAGIPDEELPKIFNRFYQTGNHGGTGIGLALSKELARLFNGQLQVESKEEKGSVFTLTIPLIVSDSKSATILAEPEDVSQSPSPVFQTQLHAESRPRILIVEDQPEMQKFLRESLSDDYECEVAREGGEALQLLQTRHFDLTSSDVMMPGMDGFSLREKVNQISSLRQMPFILLTARALDEDKLHGLRLGVDDYITKPFSVPELKARISNLLKNKFEREKGWQESSGSTQTQEEPADRELLREAEKKVLQNLDRSDYKIADLASEIGFGERQLRRVIRNLSGLSPVEFILEIRLQKARQLLEKRKFTTVSEVQFEVGIESASYFSKKFTERFGKNPSDYMIK